MPPRKPPDERQEEEEEKEQIRHYRQSNVSEHKRVDEAERGCRGTTGVLPPSKRIGKKARIGVVTQGGLRDGKPIRAEKIQGGMVPRGDGMNPLATMGRLDSLMSYRW